MHLVRTSGGKCKQNEQWKHGNEHVFTAAKTI